MAFLFLISKLGPTYARLHILVILVALLFWLFMLRGSSIFFIEEVNNLHPS